MGTLWQDIRYGLRMLRKNPGFTALAILTLALGIGANTAIFSVVNAVLLQPLPFEKPDRLLQVWHTPPQASFPGMSQFSVSPANFLDWRSRSHSFEGMFSYGISDYALTGTGQAEAVRMITVTNGFFSVLRAKPLLGRGFTEDEDAPGHDREVVLSYRFWRSHFGGNPEVVGKSIALDGQSFTIVGVMGQRFDYPIAHSPDQDPQMWKPMAWSEQERAIRDIHDYGVLARLKDGVTLPQAQAELDSVSNALALQYPSDDKGWGAIAVPIRDDLVGDVRPAFSILLGAVALVLLIACANVANLVLAKTVARSKEVAIRTALGASRYRLLQQDLAETLVLAFAGGTLGLILAHYGVALLVKFLTQWLPRSGEIALDGWVLAFTLGISLLTGLAVGLFGTLRLAKEDVSQSLKQGIGHTSSDSDGTRTNGLLAVSEVALSLMLLIGAGLLIRSLWMLHQVNPGFDPNQLLTMSVSVSPNKFPEPAQEISFLLRVLVRVRSLPSVQSAGFVDNLPLTGGSHQPISVEGQPVVAMADQPEVDVRLISPGYISAMHIPLLRGRDIDDSDVAGRPGAVLISEAMAKRFWPNQDPIGKHLTLTFFPDFPRVVTGVVADVKMDALNETRPPSALYFPVAQITTPKSGPWQSFGGSLVVRTNGNPSSVVAAVSDSVRDVDSEIPVLDIRTMSESVSDSLQQQRFTMLLLVIFAVTALVLAAAGIYGVVSYTVARRTREIGVRMALGATAADVLRMVVGQGMRTTAIGLAVGIGASFVLTRTMRSLLFGVSPTDPVTLAEVAILLAAVSFVACWIPARSATKVDPLVALRYE